MSPHFHMSGAPFVSLAFNVAATKEGNLDNSVKLPPARQYARFSSYLACTPSKQ
jgi:hypothetical protein